MRPRVWSVLAVLVAACGGSSERDSPPPGDPTKHCAELCQHWGAVGCSSETFDGCEESCRQALSTGASVACASAINARYSCEFEQPVEDYSCVAGFPVYAGNACSDESSAARACLARHAGRHPGCQRVCELDDAYCVGPGNVDSCKANCANIDQLGACSSLADAWYDCIAGAPLSGLSCDDGFPEPVDGSCSDELSALTACAT